MATRSLDLHGLADLDGGVHNKSFQTEMARAMNDINALPEIAKDREILLAVKIKPRMEKGFLADLGVTCTISPCKLPKVTPPESRLLPAKNTALFEEDSPEDPRQMSLPLQPPPPTPPAPTPAPKA